MLILCSLTLYLFFLSGSDLVICSEHQLVSVTFQTAALHLTTPQSQAAGQSPQASSSHKQINFFFLSFFLSSSHIFHITWAHKGTHISMLTRSNRCFYFHSRSGMYSKFCNLNVKKGFNFQFIAPLFITEIGRIRSNMWLSLRIPNIKIYALFICFASPLFTGALVCVHTQTVQRI